MPRKKRTKTNSCVDCGKPIEWRSTRCRKCFFNERRTSPEERFWQKVNKDGPNGCWIWTAMRNKDGYGCFRVGNTMKKAHRFSYEINKGQIPSGMEVRHICHNPSCVNPDHLEPGTHTDNMRDLVKSGNRKGIYRKTKLNYSVKKPKTVEDRFWAKVDKNGPIMSHMKTRCWKWLAYCGNSGHGRLRYQGSQKLAHRISWILHNGEIPKGLQVLHKCDNPSCTRPDHLYLGTYKDNVKDMVDRGRVVTRRGEKSNMAKLTREQVKEIREKYNSTNILKSQLAKEYKMSYCAIWNIVNNVSWKHI